MTKRTILSLVFVVALFGCRAEVSANLDAIRMSGNEKVDISAINRFALTPSQVQLEALGLQSAADFKNFRVTKSGTQTSVEQDILSSTQYIVKNCAELRTAATKDSKELGHYYDVFEKNRLAGLTLAESLSLCAYTQDGFRQINERLTLGKNYYPTWESIIKGLASTVNVLRASPQYSGSAKLLFSGDALNNAELESIMSDKGFEVSPFFSTSSSDSVAISFIGTHGVRGSDYPKENFRPVFFVVRSKEKDSAGAALNDLSFVRPDVSNAKAGNDLEAEILFLPRTKFRLASHGNINDIILKIKAATKASDVQELKKGDSNWKSSQAVLVVPIVEL